MNLNQCKANGGQWKEKEKKCVYQPISKPPIQINKSWYYVFGASIFIILISILFVDDISTLFQAEPPRCEILAGGGTCDIEFTLPKERAATLFKLDLSFESVAGQLSLPIILSQLDYEKTTETDDDDDEEETFHNYLFEVPTEFGNVHELNIKATMSGSCKTNDDEKAKANIVIRRFLKYVGTSLDVCRKEDWDDCDLNDQIKWYTGKWGKVTNYRWSKEVISEKVVKCTNLNNDDEPETESKTATAQITIPKNQIFDNFAFMVIGLTDTTNSGTVDITHPGTVEVSYRPAEYPTDLQYILGDSSIDIFQGLQTEPTPTLDFSDQVNLICDREWNTQECTFKIRFRSDHSGGIIIAEEDSILKLAVPPQCVIDVNCDDSNQYTLDVCTNYKCEYSSIQCLFGETKIKECWDNSTIVSHTCINNNYVETGGICPQLPPISPPSPEQNNNVYVFGALILIIIGGAGYLFYKKK